MRRGPNESSSQRLSEIGRLAARRAPLGVVALAILADAVLLVRDARTMWFVGDDWDFFVYRNLHSVRVLLTPHNEHWSTLPIIAFRLLNGIYGVDSYLPYAVLPICAHLILCATLYAVLRRCAIGSYASALAVVAVLFLGGGAGGENTLWDFQIGFLGSAAFGVLALLLAMLAFKGARVLTVTCLVLGLMCSGMGLVMVVWACALILFREGPVRAVLAGSVPVLVYVLWYLTYGQGYSGAPPPVPGIAPMAAVTGLADVWTVASGMPGAGGAILLLLVAGVLAASRRMTFVAVGMAGLVALVAMEILIGYSRSGLGAATMDSSRYIYFGVLLTAAPLAVTVDIALRRLGRDLPWGAVVSWVLVATLVVAVGVAQLNDIYNGRRQSLLQARGRLIAGVSLADSGARLLSNVPDRVQNPDLNLENMARIGLTAALRGRRSDATAQLGAKASMQVVVSSTSTGLASARRVVWSGVAGLANGGAPLTACVSGVAVPGAHVDIAAVPTGGAEFALRGAGATVETSLVDGDRTSVVVPWKIQPGSEQWVASTAAGTTLRVLLNPGPVVVCPGGAAPAS